MVVGVLERAVGLTWALILTGLPTFPRHYTASRTSHDVVLNWWFPPHPRNPTPVPVSPLARWGFGGNSAGGSTPPCSRPPCIGSDYMALYNASAVAVKAVHPSFKVGGPATEHLNTENFLQQVLTCFGFGFDARPRRDGCGL